MSGAVPPPLDSGRQGSEGDRLAGAAGHWFSLGTGYTPAQRYGIALLLSGVALACWHMGISDLGISPFFLYLAAVTIASSIGGLGPGLLVIVFAVVASNFSYSIPGWYVLQWPRGVLRLVLFLFASLTLALLQRERLRLIEIERVSRRRAERLRAEQAAMLEQMTEAVIVGDAEGRIVYLNEVARELYATPPLDGLPVERLADWIRVYRPNGEEVRADEFALARAAQGETFINLERIMERPDGSRVTVVANARQVRGPDGRVLGAIATIRDVTRERELERQRELLLSAMVHDLKSPLATMKGMAQLIHRRLSRATDVPEESRLEITDGLARIDAKASQMAGLIDDLIQSSRRTLVPHFREHDLLPTIRSMAEQIDRSEQDHSVELDTDLTALVGEWDVDRLERALENLIRNAVKYSPDGTTVRVAVAAEARDGREDAVVTVEDQGIGIPKAEQTRVFERFYRASNALQVASGTGIGLAAVRQTVESHGGTIDLASEEGKGTTVRVRLPLERG